MAVRLKCVCGADTTREDSNRECHRCKRVMFVVGQRKAPASMPVESVPRTPVPNRNRGKKQVYRCALGGVHFENEACMCKTGKAA